MANQQGTNNIATFAEQKKSFTETQLKTEAASKTKLILLIAANTNDPTIGNGCREDMGAVRELFKILSRDMDFNFIELVVQGKDYGKENIVGAIDLLTPGDNDIVVFYYTGHGFSYEKDAAKKYPQIDLRSLPASDKIDVINAHTENLADIFELVKSKGARLNIVIGDCCNSFIDFKRKSAGDNSGMLKDKTAPIVINKKTCEAMFCDYTASILVAAADKGQFAVSDEKLGSLFTFSFYKNLKKLLKKEIDKSEGLPWEKLLEDTTSNAFELSKTYDIGGGVPGNQKAIYNIESRKTLY